MAVRLIIQSNSLDSDARLPALLKFTAATREESGCVLAEDVRIGVQAPVLHQVIAHQSVHNGALGCVWVGYDKLRRANQ